MYHWSPFQIGRIEKGKLRIMKSHDMSGFPVFDRVRGSTVFQGTNVSTEDLLTDNDSLGVVYFSEEGNPRRYFHMLVLLGFSEGTWTPKKFSAPFYFANIGIEFCIGFSVTENHYTFWISQMDRDPAIITSGNLGDRKLDISETIAYYKIYLYIRFELK